MEAAGPGHEGSGSVVVPPYYTPHQKHHPHLHPPPPGHHHLPPQQQQPPPPQGMRVSPAPPPHQPPIGPQNSPLGHPAHSPHMSPAVGGPPHPGTVQTENRNSMLSPGYAPSGPPHMPTGPPGQQHGYPSKIGHIPPGPPGPPYGQPTYQQAPAHQYPPPRPQGHMMQQYPQNYSAPGPQGPTQGPQAPSSMPPGHQYPPRPPPHNSHIPSNQPYGYSHYGQQGWVQGMGQPTMMGNMPGKGVPCQLPVQQNQQGANSVGPRSHTPPHYLKQHLQHKMGVYAPSPGGPQMYPNGPGMSPGMVNSRESPQGNMPPPTSTPQPLTPSGSVMDGEHIPHGMPPISVNSTPNMNNCGGGCSAAVNSINNIPPQIGPDGNPIVDEASQQSTVSNTSAASGEDRSCTPKPHKDSMMGMQPLPGGGPGSGMMGVPMTHGVSHAAPSPGTVSMTSQQDDFDNMNSPGWPRSPSTGPPVYANSQPPPPPEIYRTAKPGDSILRLYEMSDSPERRLWLDKLLRFMEENKSPITACPTISKNPLDLYALYLHVRERGGFEEVTKNKQWKDVAAVMGIGASSSGSYTLRRHYMKHVLAYECKFDRGGIDPQPIISQIESSQKKKNTKTLSVPSPGSNSSSMDGFPNGPHMGGGPGMPSPYGQYPPSSEYPGHMQQRPPTAPGPGYQGYQGGQYPGYQGMHGGYPQGGYPNSGYPPDRGYQPTGPPNHQANYQGYQQQAYPRQGFPPPPPPPHPSQGYQQEQYPVPIGNNNVSTANYGTSQLAKQLLNPPPRNTGGAPMMQGYQGGPMYPQKPGLPQPNSVVYPQGPRRHPDFEKAQQGWRPPGSQYVYSSQSPQGPPQQPWPRQGDPGPQWNQPRCHPPPVQSFQNQQRWSSSFGTAVPRPPISMAPNKNYLAPQATSFKSGGYGTYMGKQLFPMDSVEAVPPVLLRRKRLCKADIPQVDPWRLLMCLRCGLVSEVTWALDILNILLFDDQAVIYFGLHHMPGLLESLIEHLRRGLINMFNICSELELGMDDEATGANKRIKSEQHDYQDRPWYSRPPPSPQLELDLGRLEDDTDPLDKEYLLKGSNFTMATRSGKSIRIMKKEGKIFMREGAREWDKWEGFNCGIDTWSVGGGECTAHIICAMQSSIATLPFTRLIPDGKISEKGVVEEEEAKKPSQSSSVVKVECKNPIISECIIKIEKVDCERMLASPFKPEPKTLKAKDKEPVSCISDKFNCPQEAPPKETPTRSIFGPKLTRKNNAKMSKLDEVLKRIKKEPIGSPGIGLSIFSKSENGVSHSDSKSILDQILKKDDESDVICTPCKEIVKEEQVMPKPISIEITDSNSKCMMPKPISVEMTDSDNKCLMPKPISVEMTDSDNKCLMPKPISVEMTDSDSKCVMPKPVSVEMADGKCIRPPLDENVKTNLEISGENKGICATIRSPTKLITISPASISKLKENPGATGSFVGLKRSHDDAEEESWSPDEASLTTTSESQDWLAKRVMSVGTIIRNLSFIPGNEDVMSKNAPLLAILGKTILLHHNHPKRSPPTAHYDRDEDIDYSDWCSSLAPDLLWWWPYLLHVHENTLVTLANIAGHLDLSYYPEEISRPILNGLLHWATCPASYGQDTFPGGGTFSQSALSPQRLALEAMVKLCVLDSNTDLVLATPPFSRLDMLCSQLTRLLCRGEEQVLREFSINLFHYFSAADSGVARAIAMQNGCVSLLLAFIEEAESAALNVANAQGVTALKENPELMGTSLDMVRRAANTLVNLSRVPDNARVISSCENRFLNLVMSQILDTYVASQLSQVLFNVAQVHSENLSIPSPPMSPLAPPLTEDKSSLQEDESSCSAPGFTAAAEEGEKPVTAELKENEECLKLESPLKETVTAASTANSQVSSPVTTFSNSISSNTSAVSTSTCSSPMSVTSHPPLSPLASQTTAYVEPSNFNSTSNKCETANNSLDTNKTPAEVSPTL